MQRCDVQLRYAMELSPLCVVISFNVKNVTGYRKRPRRVRETIGWGLRQQKRRGEPAKGDGRSPVAAARIAICYRLRGETFQVIT